MSHVYVLGNARKSLYDSVRALDQCKREVLPDLTADQKAAAQAPKNLQEAIFFVGSVDLKPARSTLQREEEPMGCLRKLA